MRDLFFLPFADYSNAMGNHLQWAISKVAIVSGALALGAGFAGAVSTTTTLQISNANPSWQDVVTLTSATTGSDHGLPNAGTASFYEDKGILLQTVNISGGTAAWSQKFLGGSHSLYVVFNGGANYSASTSSAMPITIQPALRPPSKGAFLGAAPGPNNETQMEALETAIGRPVVLHVEYRKWPLIALQEVDRDGVWHPDPPFQGDIDNNRVPVLSWTCDGTIWNSDSVLGAGNAQEDAIITATAKALAQWPGPVLLRWSWEMNDFGTDHQVCHGDTNASDANAWTQSAYQGFVSAWQRIWTLFQQAQATNVVFLWNPGSYNTSNLSAKEPYGFYPGNTFTDWIGLDEYQSAPSQTYKDNIQPFYADYTSSVYGGKPLIHGENGSANYSANNKELQWPYLEGLLSDFQANAYPQIKAYNYYDSGDSSTVDYTLDDNNGQGNGGLQAYTAIAASAQFGAMLGRNFAVSVSPVAQTVAALGGSITVPITVVPLNGFTGAINLSASGLPHGMTASFSPSSLSSGRARGRTRTRARSSGGASILTLTTSPLTPPGPTTITITGKDSTGSRVSACLAVTITGSTFTMSDWPFSATIPAGGSTQTKITVSAAGGYTGTVKLSASNLGNSGLTATFNPSSIKGGSGTSTLTLSTTASTLNTIYPVVIAGMDSENSFLTRSVFTDQVDQPGFILTVNSPGGGGQ
jgi:hypothetical protein